MTNEGYDQDRLTERNKNALKALVCEHQPGGARVKQDGKVLARCRHCDIMLPDDVPCEIRGNFNCTHVAVNFSMSGQAACRSCIRKEFEDRQNRYENRHPADNAPNKLKRHNRRWYR